MSKSLQVGQIDDLMLDPFQVRQCPASTHGLIVILESTVIAQGLPWPENLQTALAMEAAVHDQGATPRTIAILDGEVRIGLSLEELDRLSRSARTETVRNAKVDGTSTTASPSEFTKANRRDLAVVVSRKASAGTTVSATLWLAQRAGHRPCIMATGGLGGVHRGAGTSFDISTDLDELSRADGSVVVCSGFKSILDLAASLEAIETRGVAVIGYRTNDLPAFTTSSSGLPLEHRVDSVEEAATIIRAHRHLGLPGAIVVANPVPAEEAVSRDIMESTVKAALQEAERLGISGKAITPFLLEAVSQTTAGASLRANCALLVSNARLAAEIACAVHEEPSPDTAPSR